MKILITGGAGFQGSHLAADLIKKGHAITILNTRSPRADLNVKFLKTVKGKYPVKIVWGTILDNAVVDKLVKNQEVVFHLAAKVNVEESLDNPSLVTEVNVMGTVNILNAVTKHKKRLIFCSTCEVYGDDSRKRKLDEHAKLVPNSPYAASKAAADRLCYSYYKSFGTDVVIIRPFNVFGERQKSGQYGALIPILTARAIQKQSLTVFGDGKQTRDFSHVSDIVNMYNLILKKKNLSGHVINFASGKNTSIAAIAHHVAKRFGSIVAYGPARPGEVLEFNADISKATSIGWRPRTNIWSGIDSYIKWAGSNLEYFK
ncbi:MAG: GDP-mannose 4,6-dehydratase [bacterium]|nr:GDP-mannose 4,6-dehydratase [bacterium]